MPGVDVPADMFGRRGELLHWSADGAVEHDRGRQRRQQRDQREAEKRPPLPPQDAVEIARPGRQPDERWDGFHPLHRRKHRNDLLALIVEQQNAGHFAALQRLLRFRIIRDLARSDLTIHLQRAAHNQGREAGPGILKFLGVLFGHNTAQRVQRQRLPFDSIGRQSVCVDQLDTLAVIHARAHIGRLDQFLDDRSDPFGQNFQGDRLQRLVAPTGVSLVHVRNAIGVDHHRLGFHLGIGSNRDRDHTGLSSQAFSLRVDQPSVLVGEDTEADQQDRQADKIGRENAAAERAGKPPPL